MPRRKRDREPIVRWSVNIPLRLAAAVENHLWDTFLQKPKYGERNSLIVSLLESYVEDNNLYQEPPRTTDD